MRCFLRRRTASAHLVVSFASRRTPSAKQRFVSLLAQFRSLGKCEDGAFNIPIVPCDLSLCSVCGTLKLFTHANSTQFFSPVRLRFILHTDCKRIGNFMWRSPVIFTLSNEFLNEPFPQATQISTLRLVLVSLFMTTENRPVWTASLRSVSSLYSLR
jgi:hypothetical protein